ncbi:hypothetical protein [Hansschlegelia zhihuaiae]|uniref:Uncharacterized protein n=1 Tax=Hansschlegelia zhihuaiae TaxID=405005 RepID=A0A4Q0MDC4_9HYPH|nr:hypothetical protein [Hansschlegelia zhihuaiae]RXF70806.1 hypothetical protein EK403_16640 [Hansschlegelia zhihuaiae]
MRIGRTAAAAVALLLGAAPAGAAELLGPPIFIDALPGFGAITTQAVEGADGELALVFAEDLTGDGDAETIYRQIIGKRGPQGGRALVFQSSGPDTRPVTAMLAGALPLADGATLAGYVTRVGDAPVSGLYGRMIYDRDVAGGEVDFRGGALDATGGFLLPLAKRGLVVATRQNFSKRLTGYGALRFVKGSGKIGPVKGELSRKSTQIAEATRYRDGFIVRYVNPDRKFPRFVKAQIYNAEGKKTGPEVTIEPPPGSDAADQTRVLGLADGSIVVLRQTVSFGTEEVSAEVFNGDWSLKQERAVIAEIPSSEAYVTAALPVGGFVVAFPVLNRQNSNIGFETRRFGADLKPAGRPLRVELEGGARNLAIVGRMQGDAFVTYTTLLSSQTVLYGQFIIP